MFFWFSVFCSGFGGRFYRQFLACPGQWLAEVNARFRAGIRPAEGR